MDNIWNLENIRTVFGHSMDNVLENIWIISGHYFGNIWAIYDNIWILFWQNLENMHTKSG